ncbi:hypothetical protein QE382_003832 [Sphingobacterium zeae]|uniref:Uncharacterized protein n=1 Tax=Sphingobacterium zeae TaxID=1776859 RepID=A0ABU0UAI1_9SPHI|nr:hypothetical protein [Sphingobacterium zeae]MDQ1151848.1 hypothetical protein [Sphingobacterium zeae]
MASKQFNSAFQNILKYCENSKLYLGEGNPNAKILIIGKEIGRAHEKEQILSVENSNVENDSNLRFWRERFEKEYLNGYLNEITERFKNKPNSTWISYQKIVDSIISTESNEKKHDFLNHTYITELSQIHLPYSRQTTNYELINARRESIDQRKKMFKQDFYQNFPIVVMTCGHYPTRDFDFDIEDTFNVRWDQKTITLSKGNYYNLHYGKTKLGEEKILIHTRQASLGVTNELLTTIGNLCRRFYKSSIEISN